MSWLLLWVTALSTGHWSLLKINVKKSGLTVDSIASLNHDSGSVVEILLSASRFLSLGLNQSQLANLVHKPHLKIHLSYLMNYWVH